MKKGFTLAELLGVIAILGIISLIAVPMINNSINESNEKLYNTQINQMIKGAKSYYADHLDELPKNIGDSYSKYVLLQTLQDEGYLPADDIMNPKTDTKFISTETKIIVTKTDENVFEYKVDDYTEEKE